MCVRVSFGFKSFFFGFATHAFIILSHTLYRKLIVCLPLPLSPPPLSVVCFCLPLLLGLSSYLTHITRHVLYPIFILLYCSHSSITTPSLVTSGHVSPPPPAGTTPQTPKWHASPWPPRPSSPPSNTRTTRPRQSRGGTSKRHSE